MKILRDVFKEIRSMFLADSRLAILILVLVGFIAFLIKVVGVEPLIAGSGLLVGCLFILVLATFREKRD